MIPIPDCIPYCRSTVFGPKLHLVTAGADKKKALNKKQLKDVVKKLEHLRDANEKLRDSGIYWYEKLKHLLKTR